MFTLQFGCYQPVLLGIKIANNLVVVVVVV